MRLNRHPLGAILLSLAACTAPLPPTVPTVILPPRLDAPPTGAVRSAPLDLTACMEQARVAAMVAARPGEAYPVAAGCVNVIFQNALSASFIVTRVLVVVDGKRLFDRTEPAGTHGPLATIPVFRVSLGPAAAGEHTFQVLVNLRGDGTGPTAYFQGYRFEVRSSHAFTLASTGGVELRIIAYEKTSPPAPLEERPAIRYDVATRPPVAEAAVATPPVSSPKAP